MRHAIMAVLTVLLIATAVPATLLAWYRAPGGALAAMAAACVAGLAILAAIAGWRLNPWGPLAYAALLAGLAVWWVSMTPRSDRDWSADVARQANAETSGSIVAVHGVRDFDWRSETEFTERWEERSYDIAAVRTLDVFNSYWTGPAIAHTLVSFGFADGRYLAFSVEVRRVKGEAYSSLAGFFKRYELAIIAADERDIVRVRSNVRGEDVRVFRLKLPPEQVRRGLVEMLRRLDAAAARPAFYNSLVANCTTELFEAARTVAPGLPFDWRIILSGYLPDYLYDQDLLDGRLGLAEIRRRGRIAERARAADASPDFSRLIREGVPDPNAPGP